MAIKKYVASKDNTITNAFGIDLNTRSTGSNMGAADILEIFSIYGQAAITSSVELARTLIEFPIPDIHSDRDSGVIPESGSVSFYLRVFNARHSEQLPENFTINVLAVSESWSEGTGLDMVSYTDKLLDVNDGSSWTNRNKTGSWGTIGGVYHSSSYTSGSTMPNYTYTFNKGNEDVLLDVTAAVEEWIADRQPNYGFGLFLTSSFEANVTASDSYNIINTDGPKLSFYTKRFFSRSSEFFFKKPVLEARWDSRVTDDRANFYSSSSIAPAKDNLNNLYLYNYIRGRLVDIPHTETVTVKLYDSVDDKPAGGSLTSATATKIDTGIYKASIALNTTSSVIHDVWSGSIGGEYKTGSISVKNFNNTSVLLSDDFSQFTTKIANLKNKYVKNEQARMRMFTRPRNFDPTIYTVASNEIEKTIIPSASFEILRMVDEETVINNSTGSSDYHTYLSYDNSGSYFDLDMSLLEPGYMYGIKLSFYSSGQWREQEEVFKFRVEDN